MIRLWIIGFFLGSLFAFNSDLFVAFSFVINIYFVFCLFFFYYLKKIYVMQIIFFAFGFFWGASHHSNETIEDNILVKHYRENIIMNKMFLGKHKNKFVLVKKKELSQKFCYVKQQKKSSTFFDHNRYICLDKTNKENKRSASLFFVSQRIRDFFEKKAAHFPQLKSWLLALYLGKVQDIHDARSKSFKLLGVYHLLILSGLHFSIMSEFVCFFLLRIFSIFYVFRIISPRAHLFFRDLIHLFTCSFMFFYAIAVGFSQSVQRAFFVFLVHKLSRLYLPHLSLKDKITFVLLLHIIFFPIGFFHESTLLSWGSYLIVVIFYCEPFNLVRLFFHQLLLALLVLSCFGQFSLIGVFLNIILVPLFTFIYICALSLSLLSYFPNSFQQFFIQIQLIFLEIVSQLAKLPQIYPWLYLDVLGYHYSIRFISLLIIVLWFLYFLKKIAKINETKEKFY